MPVSTQMVQFTGFYYTAGKGGVALYTSQFNTIISASVIGVDQQTPNSLEINASLQAFGLNSGTLGGSTINTPNEVVVLLYNNISGTVVEIPSGTVTQTVNVLITGA